MTANHFPNCAVCVCVYLLGYRWRLNNSEFCAPCSLNCRCYCEFLSCLFVNHVTLPNRMTNSIMWQMRRGCVRIVDRLNGYLLREQKRTNTFVLADNTGQCKMKLATVSSTRQFRYNRDVYFSGLVQMGFEGAVSICKRKYILWHFLCNAEVSF